MAKIAPFGRYRAFDADGAPLAGGKLYTYEAGTSTPKTTYTDKDAGSANTNPVVLDADGYGDVWLDTGGYKFVLKDSSGNLLWEKDDIDGGSTGGYASSVISKSSGFALSINEQNNVIVCTAALTVSLLPSATAGDGFAAVFINTSSGNVTLDPDGAETINGAATLVVNAGMSVSIHTDGTAWYAAYGFIADSSVSTAKIASRAVTLAKQATGTANRLQGFDGSGNPSEVTVGQGLSLSSAAMTNTATVQKQVYTSGSGNWASPSYTTASMVFKVTVTGGGGTGGRGTAGGSAGGGGGGSGGTAIAYVTGLSASTNYAYSVGAAGNASTMTFGATTYTGSAGSNGSDTGTATPGMGGNGGGATNGTLNMSGGAGTQGGGANCGGGVGGASFWGGGGNGGSSTSSGSAGVAYGSGGGGGGSNSASGGSGAGGAIVIEWVA